MWRALFVGTHGTILTIMLPINFLNSRFQVVRKSDILFNGLAGTTALSISNTTPFCVVGSASGGTVTFSVYGTLNGVGQTESFATSKFKRSTKTWSSITQISMSSSGVTGTCKSIYTEGQPYLFETVINTNVPGRLRSYRLFPRWFNNPQGPSLDSEWMGYFNDLTIRVGDILIDENSIRYEVQDNPVVSGANSQHHMESTLKRVTT
jgi:hypothetical protein